MADVQAEVFKYVKTLMRDEIKTGVKLRPVKIILV